MKTKILANFQICISVPLKIIDVKIAVGNTRITAKNASFIISGNYPQNPLVGEIIWAISEAHLELRQTSKSVLQS